MVFSFMLALSVSQEYYHAKSLKHFHHEVEIHVTTNVVVKNILFLVMIVLGN